MSTNGQNNRRWVFNRPDKLKTELSTLPARPDSIDFDIDIFLYFSSIQMRTYAKNMNTLYKDKIRNF